MPNTRVYSRSFGAGIIGPEMFGRIEDAKYQSGAAVLRNFIATPQGPAETRAGFVFVKPTKNNGVARLIPFTYSTDQTFCIEMGVGYFRFHTQGETLLPPDISTLPAFIPSATITCTIASPAVITWPSHGLNYGSQIYFTSSVGGGMPAPITHKTVYYAYPIDANTFHISSTYGGPLINTTGSQTGTHQGYWNYNYGDLVSYGGAIYFMQDPLSGYGNPNTDTVSWYAMAADAYEVPTPYQAADLFSIHYVQSADVMTLVHPNYPPMELERLGATSWSFTAINFGPAINPPQNVAAVPTQGFKSSIAGVSNANPALITTASNHTLSMGDQIYIDGLKSDIGGVFTDISGYYLVENVPVDSSGNLIKNELNVMNYSGGTLDSSTWTSWGGPAYIELANQTYDPYSHYAVTATAQNGIDESVLSLTVNALNNLDVPGAYNTITWSAVPNAVRYTVYKERNGLFGYIGETTSLQFVDDNISADFSVTPPNYDTMFAGPGDYPSAVSYYEQRKVFGGTLNQPEGLWMSNSGTEGTFSYSVPVKATDRVAIQVAAREANTIRHLVPLTRLLPMTSAAEWAVVPIGADAITPTSISVQPQSYVGSNNVQPSVVNNLMVFCSARGGHVRELGYQWQSNAFVTGDMSLRCTQLFDNMTLVDQTHAKAPRPILWFVSSSGVLLGLTYVPEEQIGSWHLHDTDGNFESVCCVAEGNEDILYCVINRTVQGNTVRYVERMASRLFASRALSITMDAALTYNGPPATTFTGLSHLEGKTVTILADGGVVQGLVVTGGSVTLPHSASIVTVGLPYVCDLQTLPVLLQVDGYGQGRSKNINKGWVRVWLSSGIFIGPDEDHLIEAKQRSNEPYGSPPDLVTDEIMVMTTPQWQQSGQILIRQTYPLPLTVVSLTLEVAIGG